MEGLSTPPLMRDGKIYREYIGGQRSIAVHGHRCGLRKGYAANAPEPAACLCCRRALLAFDDFRDLAQNLL